MLLQGAQRIPEGILDPLLLDRVQALERVAVPHPAAKALQTALGQLVERAAAIGAHELGRRTVAPPRACTPEVADAAGRDLIDFGDRKGALLGAAPWLGACEPVEERADFRSGNHVIDRAGLDGRA